MCQKAFCCHLQFDIVAASALKVFLSHLHGLYKQNRHKDYGHPASIFLVCNVMNQKYENQTP